MTRHPLSTICLATLTLCGVALHAAEDPKEARQPLTLTTSARFVPVQSDLVVQMRVEPDTRSRELTVEWMAEDLSGGLHAITLEGDRSAATHRFAITRMAPGNYIVVATLHRSDGTSVRKQSAVSVVGAGGPDTFGGGGPDSAAGR